MNSLKITAISELATRRLKEYYMKPGRKDQKLVSLKLLHENPFTLQVNIKNLGDNRIIKRFGGFRRAFDDGSFGVMLAARLEKSWVSELKIREEEFDEHMRIEVL